MKKFVAFGLIFTLFILVSAISVCAYGVYEYDSEINSYAAYYEDYDYYEYFEEYEDASDEFEIGKSLLIAFIAGLVIALIITGVMRSKMKSVRFENAARNYIRQGSMNVLRSRDMYLYSHVTKTPRPQNNKKR